jgi:hypothetical protein
MSSMELDDRCEDGVVRGLGECELLDLVRLVVERLRF